MPTLPDDLRQLIEYDQQIGATLVARPGGAAAALRRRREHCSANPICAASKSTPALEHYRIAHELDPKNLLSPADGPVRCCDGRLRRALTILLRTPSEIAPTEHSEAMAALMLHRLGRFQEAIQAYSALLTNSSATTWNRRMRCAAWRCCCATPARRSPPTAISTNSFRSSASIPARVAGLVLERDTSIDFHGWTRFAHKSELARALNNGARQARTRHGFPRPSFCRKISEALIAYAAREPGALFIAKPRTRHRRTGHARSPATPRRSRTETVTSCSAMSSGPISSTASKAMCGFTGL